MTPALRGGIPPPRASSPRVVSVTRGQARHLPTIHLRTSTPPRYRFEVQRPVQCAAASSACMTPRRVRILNNEDASADSFQTPPKESRKPATDAQFTTLLPNSLPAATSHGQYATLTVEELLNLKSELVAAQDAWQAAGAQQHEAEASIAQLKDELSGMKACLEQVQEYRNQDQASMVELKQELVTMKVASQSLQRELEDGAGCRAALAALLDQREQELLNLKSELVAAQDAWQAAGAQQHEAEASIAQLKDELSGMKASLEQVQEYRNQDQASMVELKQELVTMK
ncbi:unnamed protein product, partial [Symbiodinium necroappetens]